MYDTWNHLSTIQRAWNSVTEYIIAWFVLIASFGVLLWFRKKFLKELEKMAEKSVGELDDLIIQTIEKIPASFYYILSLYLAFLVLNVPQRLDTTIYSIFVIVVISQFGITLIRVIMHILSKSYFNGHDGTHTIKFISFVAKWLVWAIVILLILNNIGVEITPLVTSLWIVWIAVAFALQNILEDLFCSVSLYLDKPFVIGDFIEVEWDSGTVISIGVKTTRLKTIRGEELVLANKTLTNETVRNYGKMSYRTVTNSFSVPYETLPVKLEKIPALITSLFDTREDLEIKFIHLIELGSSGITFEYRYTIPTQDYNVYLEKQQQVHLGIIHLFEQEHIGFAYPTQKVWVEEKK